MHELPDAGVAARLDALLPQTQCTRCGYEGCAPYARAIAAGEADIDRCPPGGDEGAAQLARVLGRAAKPVDRACGTPGSLLLAIIDEAACIGCTLCIDACPVDAILGAPKRMHVVLPSLCSGCELCVAPCPVDCIAMIPAGRPWTAEDARDARSRHDARASRLGRGERIANRVPGHAIDEHGKRKAAIAAALERARTRRAAGASRA
ncbi:MAG: RnfABCDGE type electron transport complex subunit B [Burkholderiales bacterium]